MLVSDFSLFCGFLFAFASRLSLSAVRLGYDSVVLGLLLRLLRGGCSGRSFDGIFARCFELGLLLSGTLAVNRRHVRLVGGLSGDRNWLRLRRLGRSDGRSAGVSRVDDHSLVGGRRSIECSSAHFLDLHRLVDDGADSSGMIGVCIDGDIDSVSLRLSRRRFSRSRSRSRRNGSVSVEFDFFGLVRGGRVGIDSSTGSTIISSNSSSSNSRSISGSSRIDGRGRVVSDELCDEIRLLVFGCKRDAFGLEQLLQCGHRLLVVRAVGGL
jgi:hypothetical protein